MVHGDQVMVHGHGSDANRVVLINLSGSLGNREHDVPKRARDVLELIDRVLNDFLPALAPFLSVLDVLEGLPNVLENINSALVAVANVDQLDQPGRLWLL